MRICVVGAGALGGYMAAKLAAVSDDLVVVERGEHLRAIESSGVIRVLEPDHAAVEVPVRTARVAELTSQDLIILGVKAHDIAAVAASLHSLLGEDTVVMTIQNGIPWWYFQLVEGPFQGTRLESLDPDGVIEASIAPERIIGCVAYPALSKPEPGTVKLISPGKFPVGELDGAATDRLDAIHTLFEEAGLHSRKLGDIRSEIWLKVLGSMSFNPISALTRATMAEIARDPGTHAVVTALMEEARDIAHKLGVTFRRTIDERISGAERVGDHKTSTLQSLERGERLEVDALIGVISEMGRITGVPTPTVDTVWALLGLLDRRVANRP